MPSLLVEIRKEKGEGGAEVAKVERGVGAIWTSRVCMIARLEVPVVVLVGVAGVVDAVVGVRYMLYAAAVRALGVAADAGALVEYFEAVDLGFDVLVCRIQRQQTLLPSSALPSPYQCNNTYTVYLQYP